MALLRRFPGSEARETRPWNPGAIGRTKGLVPPTEEDTARRRATVARRPEARDGDAGSSPAA